jgi:hypothetical protein
MISPALPLLKETEVIEINPEVSTPLNGLVVVVVGGVLVDPAFTNANIPAISAAEIVAAAPIQAALFVVFEEESFAPFGTSCPPFDCARDRIRRITQASQMTRRAYSTGREVSRERDPLDVHSVLHGALNRP